MSTQKDKKTNEKTLSAYPLKTDELLKALLDTKPPKKTRKKKSSSKSKMAEFDR